MVRDKGVALRGFVVSTVCLFCCSQLSTLAAISKLMIVRRPSMVPSPENLCFLSGPLNEKNRIRRPTRTGSSCPQPFGLRVQAPFTGLLLLPHYPDLTNLPPLWCYDSHKGHGSTWFCKAQDILNVQKTRTQRTHSECRC